jgi:hypothetical protein
MKKLKDYTAEDKIQCFDKIYKMSLDDFNESLDGEGDRQYFWEALMGEVLKLNILDWNKHNEGNRF